MDGRAKAQSDLLLGDGHSERSTIELRDVNERLLISALRQQDLAATLEAERAQLLVILEAIADAVLVVDSEGHPVLMNPAYKRLMLGYPAASLAPEDEKGQPLAPDETPWRRAGRGESFELQFSGLGLDGTRQWWEAHGQPIGAGAGASGGVLVIRDISEHKRLEGKLLHQALHDPLTGLPNRTLLYDRLDQAILLSQRTKDCLAVLLLDLDHFKLINDTLGHAAGDLLLREIAARLQLMLRSYDTVARMGGDEFIMLLPETDQAGAIEVAERVLRSMDANVVIIDQAVHVGVSIGIVVASGVDMDANTLLRQADIAMYSAKRTKSGYSVYISTQENSASSE